MSAEILPMYPLEQVAVFLDRSMASLRSAIKKGELAAHKFPNGYYVNLREIRNQAELYTLLQAIKQSPNQEPRYVIGLYERLMEETWEPRLHLLSNPRTEEV